MFPSEPNYALSDTDREKQITNIIIRFPFDKVHAYMVLTDWQYLNEGVPDLDKLQWTAIRVLSRAANLNKKTTHVATGGFYALKANGRLTLHFSIANGHSY